MHYDNYYRHSEYRRNDHHCCNHNRGFNDMLLFQLISRRSCSTTPQYIPYPVMMPAVYSAPAYYTGYPYRLM